MNNYTKIDQRHTEYGLFELWEHKVKGDTVSCVMTLNGESVLKTYDTLDIAIKEYLDY